MPVIRGARRRCGRGSVFSWSRLARSRPCQAAVIFGPGRRAGSSSRTRRRCPRSAAAHLLLPAALARQPDEARVDRRGAGHSGPRPGITGSAGNSGCRGTGAGSLRNRQQARQVEDIFTRSAGCGEPRTVPLAPCLEMCPCRESGPSLDRRSARPSWPACGACEPADVVDLAERHQRVNFPTPAASSSSTAGQAFGSGVQLAVDPGGQRR